MLTCDTLLKKTSINRIHMTNKKTSCKEKGIILNWNWWSTCLYSCRYSWTPLMMMYFLRLLIWYVVEREREREQLMRSKFAFLKTVIRQGSHNDVPVAMATSSIKVTQQAKHSQPPDYLHSILPLPYVLQLLSTMLLWALSDTYQHAYKHSSGVVGMGITVYGVREANDVSFPPTCSVTSSASSAAAAVHTNLRPGLWLVGFWYTVNREKVKARRSQWRIT